MRIFAAVCALLMVCSLAPYSTGVRAVYATGVSGVPVSLGIPNVVVAPAVAAHVVTGLAPLPCVPAQAHTNSTPNIALWLSQTPCSLAGLSVVPVSSSGYTVSVVDLDTPSIVTVARPNDRVVLTWVQVRLPDPRASAQNTTAPDSARLLRFSYVKLSVLTAQATMLRRAASVFVFAPFQVLRC